LRVETPEDGEPESTVAIDLEGSYMSIDRVNLGSHVEGGKKVENGR
jgi:hypothetical protein